MRDKLDQLFKLDLGKLNVFGWLLLLVSLAVAFGGPMVLVSTHTVEFDSDHPRRFRGSALFCWVAAAAIFFGGRWVLDFVGLSIYRKDIKGPRTRRVAKSKAGIVVAFVGVAVVFFIAYQAVKGPSAGSSLEAKLQRTAAKLSRQTPKQIDATTRWERVEAGPGKTLSYRAQPVFLAASRPDDVVVHAAVNQWNTVIQSSGCH